MMNTTTLSVLISVYKSEKPCYLDSSLESVIKNQTLKPNNVIIVEDGPLTTGLYDVISKWCNNPDVPITIIKNEVNMGLTKSLNRGLEYVNTDLVARMDSDDMARPNRFELQVKFFNENPNIDIIGGAIHEIDENGNDLCDRYYPLDHESVCKSICKANPIAHPTVMIRKRVFDSGLKYNERFRTNQDLALWFDCILAGYKLANLRNVILLFRRQSSVYNRRKKIKNLWREFYIYCDGIFRLNGIFTIKYAYPIMRLCLKLLPTPIVKWAYNSRIRRSTSK